MPIFQLFAGRTRGWPLKPRRCAGTRRQSLGDGEAYRESGPPEFARDHGGAVRIFRFCAGPRELMFLRCGGNQWATWLSSFLRTNLWTFAPLCAARLSMMVHASRLVRLFGMPLVCLTFFALSGGHWALFQAIAWAQMIRDYSRTATIVEAIDRTFNGRSPCGMCTKISEERQKEKSTPATGQVREKRRNFVGGDALVSATAERRGLQILRSGRRYTR
jgi:hypothetical protein